TMASSAFLASSSSKTMRASRARSSWPSSPSTSGPNRWRISSRAGSPGSTTSRAHRSASMTAAPSSLSRRTTVLLPVATPPVSPMSNTYDPSSPLAAGAEKTAAAGQDDALDGTAARRAGHPFPPVHPEPLLKPSLLPVGAHIFPEPGPLGLDPLAQHVPERRGKPGPLVPGLRRRGPPVRDAGPEKALVRVDVPEAGHVTLVQQEGFHRPLPPGEHAAQTLRRKLRVERIDPQRDAAL